jgi:hypothetical protein
MDVGIYAPFVPSPIMDELRKNTKRRKPKK